MYRNSFDDALASAGVLGTLVHRAVGMPFTKPQRIRNGNLSYNRQSLGSISEAVAEAAFILRTAVTQPPGEIDEVLSKAITKASKKSYKASGSKPGTDAPLERYLSRVEASLGVHGAAHSLAHQVYDRSGFWWSEPLKDLENLTINDEERVLGMFEAVAVKAGEALQAAAIADEWTWLYSENSMVTDFFAPSRPAIGYSDLLAGHDPAERKITAIELKTGLGKAVSDISQHKATGQLAAAEAFLAGRPEMTDATIETLALLVPALGDASWKAHNTVTTTKTAKKAKRKAA